LNPVAFGLVRIFKPKEWGKVNLLKGKSPMENVHILVAANAVVFIFGQPNLKLDSNWRVRLMLRLGRKLAWTVCQLLDKLETG